ncbi:hypothetical protein D5F01_LYC23716 [Scomber scombrus]|uniref:HAT C-terminal dimerisation domain-containing protein n=1 Tax=Scomber scombrus TaxID=13677 RepID=A0AAV1QFI1_SCOSC
MSVAETQENLSEMSQPSTSEDVGSQEDQPTLVHPWLYLEEFFKVIGCKNNSFRMCCKLCAPKYHELMAFKNSLSNLKNIFRFTPVELAFIAEYAKTMSPVAKALDILQVETSVQMGWLVPTITLLRTKLQHLHVTSKFCLDYIRSHLDCQAKNHVSEGSQSSEEEDFFPSLKKTGPLETTQQLDAYLGCPGDTVEVLKSFPAVCQLSLKLNTALPALAACEILFSVAGLIFRPRRACIGSKNFENQLLLQLNKAYW